MWSSADGVSWQVAAEPVPAVGDPFVAGLATGPAGVVAIGDIDGRAAAWTSTDLRTWTEAGAAWGPDAFLESVVILDGTIVIAGNRSARPTLWVSLNGLEWLAVDLPIVDGVDGEAAKVGTVDGAVVAFGYTTKDAGNGGSSRIADLVWTLTRRLDARPRRHGGRVTRAKGCPSEVRLDDPGTQRRFECPSDSQSNRPTLNHRPDRPSGVQFDRP